MNEYQDQWTRYHHKPTDGISSSSGNGWIYSAYAAKVGLPLDQTKLTFCFNLCSAGKLIRNPNEVNSPISRDEILGMTALGYLRSVHLNGWNFSPYPLPKFSALKLLKQLYEISPSFIRNDSLPFNIRRLPEYRYKLEFKHRNYFWQNNLDQIYRFAFSVPLTDRHFILTKWGKFQWYNPVHLFYKALAFADSKTGKGSGIRWLKYGVGKAEMAKEFPADHPITLAVK